MSLARDVAYLEMTGGRAATSDARKPLTWITIRFYFLALLKKKH